MRFRSNRKIYTIIELAAVFLFLAFAGFVPGARADTLNQSRAFFIDDHYDAYNRSTVTATLVRISGRAYGFVENNYWNGIGKEARNTILNKLELILSEFDDRIYPVETAFFGSEPNPGVDGDSRITILFTPLIENAGGYFNSADVFKWSSENNESNQREMFYVNISLIADTDRIKNFIAHEFQHLISLNQKEILRNISEDTWFNELRSEYALTLLGYNDGTGSGLQRRLQSFLAEPSDSLTEWKNLPSDYGQIALFGEYIVEHWTKNILADSLKNNLVGIPSLEAALIAGGYPENFSNVFRDWMIANILNDRTVNSKFGYERDILKRFQVATTKTFGNLDDDLTLAISDSLKDWQARWYELSEFARGNNSYLKLVFSSPSLTSFHVGYLVVKTDGRIITGYIEPTGKNNKYAFSGIGSDTSKIILMPYKKDKLSGFTANESQTQFSFTVNRVASADDSIIDPFLQPKTAKPIISAKPSDYGLTEGDFIRAEGDYNIYIVNNFGYKRLVLSPEICLQYGHLGARGCFGAVKIVSTVVRDAFRTSWLFTNGETKDGRIYKLQITGEDTADLHWLNITGLDFLSQGGDFNSVFLINAREQASYSLATPIFSL